MHDTALTLGRLFFETYWRPGFGRVLDVGAQDVNGSLRPLCPPGALYVGLDIGPGAGVDIVGAPGSAFPFKDASFDVVLSTSCFEHDPMFWETLVEMGRVARDGGYIYLNAPSNGVYHAYPADHWRFYPDAGVALARWATRRGRKLELLESCTVDRAGDIWNDFVAVFAVGEPRAAPNGFLADRVSARNIRKRGTEGLEKESSATEDMQLIAALKDRVGALEDELGRLRAEAETGARAVLDPPPEPDAAASVRADLPHGDRVVLIREWIAKDQIGVEIGPYFRPLVPKREGFQALGLDVFPTAELRARAAVDPYLPAGAADGIEEVDIVASASGLRAAVEAARPGLRLDYIVSSHNFEHIPDPIRFLQDCEHLLRRGGVLSMAIPDKRTCFDYFRPWSTLSPMLDAYFEKRDRPTPSQVFDLNAYHSRYMRNGDPGVGFSLTEDPANNAAMDTLQDAFSAYERSKKAPDVDYIDTHCWTFTPASFELLLHDLNRLGLVGLRLTRLYVPGGNEFIVHLHKYREPGGLAPGSLAAPARRQALLQQILSEVSENSLLTTGMRHELVASHGGNGAAQADPVAEVSLRRALDQAQRELKRLKSSPSWRATRFLRALQSGAGRR